MEYVDPNSRTVNIRQADRNISAAIGATSSKLPVIGSLTAGHGGGFHGHIGGETIVAILDRNTVSRSSAPTYSIHRLPVGRRHRTAGAAR